MILRAISDRVETMLKDTGPSIPEQQVKRVFDPFISASGSTNAAWPWLACVQLRRGAVESGAAVDPAHAGLRQGADGHSGVGGCEQNHGGWGSHGKAVGQADHRRRVALDHGEAGAQILVGGEICDIGEEVGHPHEVRVAIGREGVEDVVGRHGAAYARLVHRGQRGHAARLQAVGLAPHKEEIGGGQCDNADTRITQARGHGGDIRGRHGGKLACLA